MPATSTTPTRAATTAAIVTRGLRKRYGDRLVVDDLDLTVAMGSITCLLGPNGSRTTTTVECLR